MKTLVVLATFISFSLAPYLHVTASPTLLIPKSLPGPSLVPSDRYLDINTTSLTLTSPNDNHGTWPSLPHSVLLPPTPAHLILTNFRSPILSPHQTTLFLRLLATELDYLTNYPYQFNAFGISVARKFTSTFLTCHQAWIGGKWTIEVAIVMLKALGDSVGEWGVRGFDFEVWEGTEREMECRVWVEEGGEEKDGVRKDGR